jgi:guanylate kinase
MNARQAALSCWVYLGAMPAAKPYVISAPSGAGKNTLISALMARFPGRFAYSISATTRKPRVGEVDGVHYYFRTHDEFRAMIEAEELAEWMEVHGNFYGTPRGPVDALLASGTPVILDLDVYGKVNFDRIYPEAIGILIVPPSLAVLEERLRGRGTDSEETIALRLKNAVDELAFAREKGKYEFTVVNDDLETAVNDLARIVGG